MVRIFLWCDIHVGVLQECQLVIQKGENHIQEVLQEGQMCLERKLVVRLEQILGERLAKVVMVHVNAKAGVRVIRAPVIAFQ